MDRLADLFLDQVVPRPQFLTVFTSDNLHRWEVGPSGQCGALMYSFGRESGPIMFAPMNTYFLDGPKRRQNADSGTFSNLNHIVGSHTRPTLFLGAQDTSLDVVGVSLA